MQKLTGMQQKVYDYLKNEIKDKGYPPSVREICAAVGLSSTSSVHAHLSSLEDKGYIRRSRLKNRSIEVLEDNFYSVGHDVVELPIVGMVTAGAPILAEENIDGTFPIPVEYIKGRAQHFMLRVRGDSMRDKGILNGDLVIVRQQSTANDGDVVVALIEDSATVKTFYREKDFIRLQPENPEYSPIYVRDMSVLGVVTGLFREMQR